MNAVAERPIADLRKSAKKARVPEKKADPTQQAYAPEMTGETEFLLTLLIDRVDGIISMLTQLFGNRVVAAPTEIEGLNGTVTAAHRFLGEALALLDGITRLPDDLEVGLTEAYGLLDLLVSIIGADGGQWHMADDIYSGYFDAVFECTVRAKRGLDLISVGERGSV